MTPQTLAPPSAADVGGDDETGWLEATAAQVRAGNFAGIDAACLAEYLESIGRRDRQEVESRLLVLVTHLLKREHQPDKRSRGWQLTVDTQRRELRKDVAAGTLRQHALEIADEIRADARRRASLETGLPVDTFPADPVGGVDDWTTAELVGDVPD